MIWMVSLSCLYCSILFLSGNRHGPVLFPVSFDTQRIPGSPTLTLATAMPAISSSFWRFEQRFPNIKACFPKLAEPRVRFAASFLKFEKPFPKFTASFPNIGKLFPNIEAGWGMFQKPGASLRNPFPISRNPFPSLGNRSVSLGNPFPIFRNLFPILGNARPCLGNRVALDTAVWILDRNGAGQMNCGAPEARHICRYQNPNRFKLRQERHRDVPGTDVARSGAGQK